MPVRIYELEPLSILGIQLPFFKKLSINEVPVSKQGESHDVVLQLYRNGFADEESGLLARRIRRDEIMLANFGDTTYREVDRLIGSAINTDPRTRGKLRFVRSG